MCPCDKDYREQNMAHQQKLLDQLFVLGKECHAWREVSDRFPPAHMLKYMRETDSCGWSESMRKGVMGFPTGMNFWQRLKYLFWS